MMRTEPPGHNPRLSHLPLALSRNSIAFKMALFVSVLLIVTAGAMVMAGYGVARSILLNQIHERLSLAAADRHAMVLAYVAQQEQLVSLVASRTRLRQLVEKFAEGEIDAASMRQLADPILLDARKSSANFKEIWIADSDGNVIAATDINYIGRNDSDKIEFQLGRNGKHLGVPRMVDGTYLAHLSAPAETNAGRPLGVVMVLLDVKQLFAIMSSHGLGETGEVLIARRVGERAEYLFPPRASKEASVALDQVPSMANAISGLRNNTEEVEYNNARVLAQYQPIAYQPHNQPWGLVAKIDTSEAYQPLRTLGFVFLLLEAGVLVIGLTGSSWLARRFTMPIREMTSAATRIADGDCTSRVASRSDDELGELGRVFNEMAEKVAAAQETLEQRVNVSTAELTRESTERLNAEERLARQALVFQLVYRTVVIAAETNSLEGALKGCVDAVCEMTGWPVGHAYLVNPSGRKLVPSKIWHSSDDGLYGAFREVTERTNFEMGIGLPGRIWKSGEPAWIVNVQEDANFPRAG